MMQDAAGWVGMYMRGISFENPARCCKPSRHAVSRRWVPPFLPTYLTFEEIGDRLSISRHTVKTRAMSIYGKL
jgi:predicted DNA-binding protein (UPF0251 family)